MYINIHIHPCLIYKEKVVAKQKGLHLLFLFNPYHHHHN